MINIISKYKIKDTSTKILISFLFTILIALSAKISVPFYPVPMTMQTFVVLLCGVILGPKFGFITLSLYFFEGAIGLPVFQGTPERGLGILYLMGPTGGYLVGFIISAFLAGLFLSNTMSSNSKSFTKLNNRNNLTSVFVKLLIALTPVYFFGLIWLGIILGWDKPILKIGLYPFIVGEFFKITLLSLIICKLNNYKLF
tara:strand:- start:1382 stop:1978 length:597 start_codon:yes stop_codon:yes gene_type:complete